MTKKEHRLLEIFVDIVSDYLLSDHTTALTAAVLGKACADNLRDTEYQEEFLELFEKAALRVGVAFSHTEPKE